MCGLLCLQILHGWMLPFLIALKTEKLSRASRLLRNTVLCLGALVMMFITSTYLTLLVIGVIPVVVLPLIFAGRAVSKRSKAAQDRLAEAGAYLGEAVGAARTMKAFNMEKATISRFQTASEEAFKTASSATRARSYLAAAAMFVVSVSVVGVLWYGAGLVLKGDMSSGVLSQFILYAIFAASGLGQLSEVYGEMSEASGAASRLAEWLQAEPSLAVAATPYRLHTPARGQIEFKNVHFSYPTATYVVALKNISFCVKSGEKIALVGPSGSGKTTLLQLLSRFYDPEEGIITLDGTSIQDFDPQNLRQQMALVTQDAVVFGASVLDNIRYGTLDAPLEHVMQAARDAAAHDFIIQLPQGYDTLIGERGVTLSGGQRQRLALARALLKNAPILLLDEATSALDSESEHLVQEAVTRLSKNRTTFIVAHRLATVLKADRIFVFEAGELVEQGTHAELLAQNGLYSRLAKLQFLE
jgi:ATP-binding cassette, subfamily B, bacterial